MSAGQFCGVCRHWQDAERSADETLGWGWCRRYPPRVSDHVASMVIERPKFGGRNYDPEDVVTVSAVSDASIFPATWHDEFCGEFTAAPASAEPEGAGGRHADLLHCRNSLIEADGVVADADLTALNRLDTLLMEMPARNLDEVVSKLLLITANLAMGHATLDDDAKRVISEARALGVEVKLA